MFSAIRRGRREAQPTAQGRCHQAPSPVDQLLRQCRATGLALAQGAAVLCDRVGVEVAAAIGGSAPRGGPLRPLLASVTGSAPGGDGVITVPSKSRPLKKDGAGAGPAAAADAAGAGGGGGGLVPPGGDADSRILISEVCVRGLVAAGCVGGCTCLPDLGRRSLPRPSAHTPHPALLSALGSLQVEVVGVEGELRDVAQAALTTKPNFAYTLREVQADLQRVFDTGFFATCRPLAEDTRDGVKLTIQVTANPELRGFVATGADALPQAVVQAALAGLHGRTLNFNAMAAAVATLNQWYEDRGILGQVVDVEMGDGGVAALRLSEATVHRINLRYLDPKTGEAREEGRTRPEVILRQVGERERIGGQGGY